MEASRQLRWEGLETDYPECEQAHLRWVWYADRKRKGKVTF